MKVIAKIFSCNWETYKDFYKRAVQLAYKENGTFVSYQDISYELEIIPGDTIQKQRNPKTRHSRTIRVYEDGIIRFVIAVSNTNYDKDKKKETDEAKRRLEMGEPLNGDIETERKRAKYVYNKPRKDYHGDSFLNQGATKILNTFFDCQAENPNVKIYWYLTDTKDTLIENCTNLINCRKYATVGIRVLNIDDIEPQAWRKQLGLEYKSGDSIAYTSFNSLVNDIALVSSKDRSMKNKPRYIKCIETNIDEDQESPKIEKYIYTFKGLGANAYDSFMIMWPLITLAKKENKQLEFLFAPEKYNFRLGQDHPRFTQDIPKTIIELFCKIGIDVKYETTDEALQLLDREKDQYEKARAEKSLRNQELFRNNLRAKGIQTKCYLCGCEVESILQAAHFWGVAQIKSATSETINQAINDEAMKGVVDTDSKYAKDLFYKRYMLANSGNNGVWLCSNHHGMFDSHHFVFDSESGKVILTTDTIGENYFRKLTNNDALPKEVLTEQTKAFLKYATKKQ